MKKLNRQITAHSEDFNDLATQETRQTVPGVSNAINLINSQISQAYNIEESKREPKEESKR